MHDRDKTHDAMFQPTMYYELKFLKSRYMIYRLFL